MGRLVDVDDLIDARDVAKMLGLSHSNTVFQYQRRYADMPRPVVDRGANRARLWLGSEVRAWAGRRPGAPSSQRH